MDKEDQIIEELAKIRALLEPGVGHNSCMATYQS